MPSTLDLSVATLVSVVILTIWGAYFDLRFRRKAVAGVPGALRSWCRGTIIQEWLLVGLVIGLWASERRPWRLLGLEPPAPTDWRLYAGLVVGIFIAAMLLRQNVKVRRLSADRLQRLVPRFAGLEFLAPRSMRDYQWFLALSCTAGVCEELLYRGFLMWVVASYTGTAAALLIVSVAFGLPHAYQGRRGMVRAGTTGLVMGCIVLLSGWLVPAMVVHAMLDISSGLVGFAVLGEGQRPLAAQS